ncbi:MAG: ABC transporter ATP-binding protein [Nitrospinota bacterium]|nr:MAG: ABC transporter ATP-binding protein [Nitrospinota bacterium]
MIPVFPEHRSMGTQALLETQNLSKRFGGLTAVHRVSLRLEPGEIRGVIGPNGSGKTTLVNLLSGLYDPTEGMIFFGGERIDRLRPNLRTARGMIRTFQIPKLFRHMTVLENMMVPALADSQQAHKTSIEEVEEKAWNLLRFVKLDHLARAQAADLSGGQAMLLQIARGFMIEPLKLYLMDEPFAGVNPVIKEVIMESILTMNREQGVTFLVVSHEMPTIRRLCQKISVMHEGAIIAEGGIEEVANDPLVIEAYLGS